MLYSSITQQIQRSFPQLNPADALSRYCKYHSSGGKDAIFDTPSQPLPALSCVCQNPLGCWMVYGLPLRGLHIFGTVAAFSMLAAGAAAIALSRKEESLDELERERRVALVKGGRIIDATVIDISDLSAEESGRPMGLQLILYKYEISGVIYEASQDVTLLKHIVNIYDCRLGFPASVRYDPHNPTNSLIVAEGWSGLRDTAQSIPLRPIRRIPRPQPSR